MVKCPECKSENKPDAKFCHNCGANLSSKNDYKENSTESYFDKDNSGSHSSFYDYSANSTKSNSTVGGLKDRFNNLSTIKKIIVACCAVYIILMILSLFSYTFLGIPIEPFTESENAKHDYSSIDLDEDGSLSYEELSIEYSNVSSSELRSIFKQCDKNDNNLIAGAEYDNLLYKINNYFESLEKKRTEALYNSSSSSSGSSSSGSSSSSSSSSSSYDYFDGTETCPYCGSEAIYESGGVYRCGECGATISNPDDLYLNDEEGYIDLLAPLAIAL